MDERKYLTEEDILAKRAETASGLPEDDVEVPSLGGWVTVRGLTRDEVYAMRKAADNDPDTLDGQRQLVIERKMIAKAMLQPKMSESAVGGWQISSTAGEIDPVTDKISELSGLSEGASKSGVQAAGDGAGSGDGVLPGGEAGPDGGRAEGEPE